MEHSRHFLCFDLVLDAEGRFHDELRAFFCKDARPDDCVVLLIPNERYEPPRILLHERLRRMDRGTMEASALMTLARASRTSRPTPATAGDEKTTQGTTE